MSDDTRSGTFATNHAMMRLSCDAADHCVTCSDEALPACVLRIDEEAGLGLVAVRDTILEVDLTLVDDVRVGQVVLVHAGVAICHLDEA